MSARFNPAARTRTRTRSSVGRGASATSRISKTSTPPKDVMVTAFILLPASSSNLVFDSSVPLREQRFVDFRCGRQLNKQSTSYVVYDDCPSIGLSDDVVKSLPE